MLHSQGSPAKPEPHESKDVKFQQVEDRLAAAPLGMQGLGGELVPGVEGFRFSIKWAGSFHTCTHGVRSRKPDPEGYARLM